MLRRVSPPSGEHGRYLGCFAVIGVANTTIDVAIFGLTHHALGVVVANAISTASGMLFGFAAHSLVTFRTRPTRSVALRFFVLTSTLMWLVQPALIVGIAATIAPSEIAGQPALTVSKVVAVGLCAVASGIGCRVLVWRDRAGTTTHDLILEPT